MSIQTEIQNRQVDLDLWEIPTCIVLGVGGIGSWVALDLALSGKVNRLILIDPDVIELSNLNRTPFRLCDVGESKVTALKNLILERRPITVSTYQEKTSDDLADTIYHGLRTSELIRTLDYYNGQNLYCTKFAIIDCRDDVYQDFYKFPCKYYKVGYDGVSVTIDGNPRNTAVWGQANGYRFTPSFVCSSQIIASMVVMDLLLHRTELTGEGNINGLAVQYAVTNKTYDVCGRFNAAVTFDVNDIIEDMYIKNNPKIGQ